jgi:hypothetical protein
MNQDKLNELTEKLKKSKYKSKEYNDTLEEIVNYMKPLIESKQITKDNLGLKLHEYFPNLESVLYDAIYSNLYSMPRNNQVEIIPEEEIEIISEDEINNLTNETSNNQETTLELSDLTKIVKELATKQNKRNKRLTETEEQEYKAAMKEINNYIAKQIELGKIDKSHLKQQIDSIFPQLGRAQTDNIISNAIVKFDELEKKNKTNPQIEQQSTILSLDSQTHKKLDTIETIITDSTTKSNQSEKVAPSNNQTEIKIPNTTAEISNTSEAILQLNRKIIELGKEMEQVLRAEKDKNYKKTQSIRIRKEIKRLKNEIKVLQSQNNQDLNNVEINTQPGQKTSILGLESKTPKISNTINFTQSNQAETISNIDSQINNLTKEITDLESEIKYILTAPNLGKKMAVKHKGKQYRVPTTHQHKIKIMIDELEKKKNNLASLQVLKNQSNGKFFSTTNATTTVDFTQPSNQPQKNNVQNSNSQTLNNNQQAYTTVTKQNKNLVSNPNSNQNNLSFSNFSLEELNKKLSETNAKINDLWNFGVHQENGKVNNTDEYHKLLEMQKQLQQEINKRNKKSTTSNSNNNNATTTNYTISSDNKKTIEALNSLLTKCTQEDNYIYKLNNQKLSSQELDILLIALESLKEKIETGKIENLEKVQNLVDNNNNLSPVLSNVLKDLGVHEKIQECFKKITNNEENISYQDLLKINYMAVLLENKTKTEKKQETQEQENKKNNKKIKNLNIRTKTFNKAKSIIKGLKKKATNKLKNLKIFPKVLEKLIKQTRKEEQGRSK